MFLSFTFLFARFSRFAISLSGWIFEVCHEPLDLPWTYVLV